MSRVPHTLQSFPGVCGDAAVPQISGEAGSEGNLLIGDLAADVGAVSMQFEVVVDISTQPDADGWGISGWVWLGGGTGALCVAIVQTRDGQLRS